MRDLKEKVCLKAEDLAEERCGRPFDDLPPYLQQQIWMDAEQEAKSQEQMRADGIYDRMREEGR